MTGQDARVLMELGQLVVLVLIYLKLRSAFPAHKKTADDLIAEEHERMAEDYEEWKRKKDEREQR